MSQDALVIYVDLSCDLHFEMNQSWVYTVSMNYATSHIASLYIDCEYFDWYKSLA